MRGYCVKGWLLWCLSWMAVSVFASEIFPDGTPIPEWFREHRVVSVKELGKQYCITNYGVQMIVRFYRQNVFRQSLIKRLKMVEE